MKSIVHQLNAVAHCLEQIALLTAQLADHAMQQQILAATGTDRLIVRCGKSSIGSILDQLHVRIAVAHTLQEAYALLSGDSSDFDLRHIHLALHSNTLALHPIDLIKIYFDFRNAFCVSIEFGSYAARNMFP